jgi:HAD superfamily hydrolase (TIGR01458 family)
MIKPNSSPVVLRAALAGVRALILDADGVLVMKGAALPGAVEAVRALEAAGVPFRVATNYSSIHRSGLAARLQVAGFPISTGQVVTAGSATAEYTARTYGGQPIFVINRPDGLREFEGQRLMTAEEADEPNARAAAVVLADGDEHLSFANMNRAFRLLLAGAELVASHRNPWWFTEQGPTIDAGSFVAGLEFSVGRRARVCGKPGPVMFRSAFDGLVADVAAAGGRRLVRSGVLMVGDDPRSDIGGARRLGMRGALVLSGRTTPEAAAALLAGMRRPTTPDAVAAGVGDVVAALMAQR